jgi:type II secretory pathway component PulM
MSGLAELLQNRRKLLLAAAAVLAALILYASLLPTLYTKNRELRQQVSQALTDAEWMRSAADKVRRLRQSQTGSRSNSVSMLTAINQSASAAFGTTIKRIEENKQGSVQIWFEHAVFDELVLWLDKLEADNGIQASLVVIDKTAYPGRVNARILLEAG